MPLPPTIVPFVPRAIDAALREHVLELVTQLEAEHGAGREPNPRASSRKEIRFGKKGSLAVVVAGENKGRITDHEEESRGEAPLRYIARMKGLDEHSALLWSKDWLVENGYLSAATKAAKHAPKPKSGPAAESGTRDSTKAAKVWGEARSIEDTLAERYLREKRGFGDGPLPVDNLRLHPGIWAEERTWPALLAAAFDEKGQIARIVAVLLDRGTADKAPVGTQKLTFGRGAAEYPVKFDANLPSADPLLLTEGPEDAIAIWSAFAGNRHAAASLGAVNLSKAKITGDVVVCGDNDSVGYEKALVAAKALAARGCQVAIAFPPSGIKDFNDLFDAKGAEAVQAAIEAAEPYVPTPAEIEEASVEKWQDALLLGQGGAPLAVEANVITTLRLHPDLAGKVRLNEFAQDVECADMPWRRGEGWRAWTDDDDTGLAEWCQHHRIMTKPAAVMPAVYRVAADHPHHPVHDYVESLAWDGVPRLDTWPERYLGATIEPGREEYLRQVGRRWFISLVARGSDEGCKVDHLLVLEGRQGAGKSSALAALVPEPGWFTDEIADLGSKDSAQDLRGKLLIEIAELSALRRGEVERIKAYLSRSTDHYRPSYGRRSRDFPRQCVFAGTTNSDAYLQDETGNRRFWGVKVGTIDLDALKRDRDQLWAEAAVAYRSGEKWWLDAEVEALARQEQAERRVDDTWEEPVLRWAEAQELVMVGGVPHHETTVADCLSRALLLAVDRHEKPAQMRVGGILKAAGWQRASVRRHGVKVRVYRRPATTSAAKTEVVAEVVAEKASDFKAATTATTATTCFAKRDTETSSPPTDPLPRASGHAATDLDASHSLEGVVKEVEAVEAVEAALETQAFSATTPPLEGGGAGKAGGGVPFTACPAPAAEPDAEPEQPAVVDDDDDYDGDWRRFVPYGPPRGLTPDQVRDFLKDVRDRMRKGDRDGAAFFASFVAGQYGFVVDPQFERDPDGSTRFAPRILQAPETLPADPNCRELVGAMRWAGMLPAAAPQPSA